MYTRRCIVPQKVKQTVTVMSGIQACINIYVDSEACSSTYVCLSMLSWNDAGVSASRVCQVRISGVSYREKINLKIFFCHSAVLTNRLNKGVLTMGKRGGRQPVLLVESAWNR